MNHSLGLTIETLVAVLLMVTIGYCMLLNSRLKRLKADEHSLKAVIAELVTATEIAERAIGGLKHTVRDVNENLENQIATATQISEHLKHQLAEGDHVVRRLTKIAIAARPQSSDAEAAQQAAGETLKETPKDTPPRESARELFRESFREGAGESQRTQPANTKLSSAKAVAAAAQAFSDRRRNGGIAA
jgi:hypothetical protein